MGLALNDGSNEVPEPAPQPTPTNNATTPSPTPGHEIVDHPDARIYQIVVSATDPDVRAVMWGCPMGHRVP
ncbi:MAG: hypothetical protein HZY75_14345 [Nocardioidaceae bacterium]|nr:MAG: hypothetical protein HZY75_14345 [Nocardioidaceae bacterium]